MIRVGFLPEETYFFQFLPEEIGRNYFGSGFF
jgi:hypothetical protein